MQPWQPPPAPRAANKAQLRAVCLDGALGGVLSALVLAWRSRIDTGRGAAALNAPSHWVHGAPALRRDAVTWRHTVLGFAIHTASSFFWAVWHRQLRVRRRAPTPANALVDAAVITAAAALVDLRVVPPRLSPGFEHRLDRTSLVLVYAAFGAGLLLGACVQRR
jgi:hypothetical protein